MKIFVTGATGLLGSHLLWHLMVAGHRVKALRRPQSRLEEVRAVFREYPDGERLWQNVEWIEGDVLERKEMESPVREAGCVFHCAAVVSFDGADRESLLRTNMQGSDNIAGLCCEYGVRLCYVSSIAALGDPAREGDMVDEETPEIAGSEHSVYSRSKGEAEKIIWTYIRRGLNVVIVNPSIILGAGLWNRSSSRLFVTASRGIPVYTRGGNGYVDVRDVCLLMICLAMDERLRGERFVLNGGNHTYRELFGSIARAAGIRPPWFYMAPWMTSIAWRLLAFWGTVVGKKPAFTRETARSANHRSFYSSAKVMKAVPDFRFRPLQETVEWMQREYKGF